jgi:hypothetical protein
VAETQNVVVGWLHGPVIPQEFHHSLFGLFVRDTWQSQRILDFAPHYAHINVCKHRNQMVSDFLAKPNAEWLLMLDSDAVFRPTILDDLLAAADPVERPIIGALAHQFRGRTDPETLEPVFGSDGLQIRECLPTMYRTVWNDDGDWVGYREITSYRLGLCEVDATGCHTLLVHRSVFEAIKSEHPYRWFREDEIAPGTIAGEDIWFCLRARELGFPIFVHTGLESGHVKPVVLTSEHSHVERIT